MERVVIDTGDTIRVVFSVLSARLKILSNLIHKQPILVCEVNSPSQDSSNVTASKTVIFIEDIVDRSFVTTL